MAGPFNPFRNTGEKKSYSKRILNFLSMSGEIR